MGCLNRFEFSGLLESMGYLNRSEFSGLFAGLGVGFFWDLLFVLDGDNGGDGEYGYLISRLNRRV